MGFEDGLLIGVALVIALNRLFVGTRLLRSRAAYVFVQGFNVGAVFALFFARLFPDFRLDYAVRGFLMLFVAWHMVQNFVMRAAVRRPTGDEDAELAAAREQIKLDIAAEREEDRRLEEAAAAQSEPEVPSEAPSEQP